MTIKERGQQVRGHTLSRLAELEFPTPPEHLPVLADDDFPLVLRPSAEVIERALVLNVRINLSLGMPSEIAREWLTANGLIHCLTQLESQLVEGAVQSDDREQLQVEGLWALGWALGLIPEMDHRVYCGDQLAALLPDLRTQETSQEWRARVKLIPRSIDEIWNELDLLYAMTWAAANANLSGAPAPGAIHQYVLWERRRALEFLRVEDNLGHEHWDNVDLST